MELEWDSRQWERERKKRDGWKLIYDSRSSFFCAAHATVTVHPLTDGWSHSRAVQHDNGSPPPHMAIAQMDLSCGWPWSSVEWRIRHGPDCRYSHRAEDWTHSRGRTYGRKDPTSAVFQARLWRVYRFFFVSSLFSLHRGGQLPHPQIRANDFPYSVYLKYEFHLILRDFELSIYVLWTWLFSGGFVSVNAIEKKGKHPVDLLRSQFWIWHEDKRFPNGRWFY